MRRVTYISSHVPSGVLLYVGGDSQVQDQSENDMAIIEIVDGVVHCAWGTDGNNPGGGLSRVDSSTYDGDLRGDHEISCRTRAQDYVELHIDDWSSGELHRPASNEEINTGFSYYVGGVPDGATISSWLGGQSKTNDGHSVSDFATFDACILSASMTINNNQMHEVYTDDNF